MFTIAARYAKDGEGVGEPSKTEKETGVMWEAGCEYLEWAKTILSEFFWPWVFFIVFFFLLFSKLLIA